MSNSLPQGWEEDIIENISVKVFSGGTPNTRNELFWNGKFNWLSSGETRNKYIISTEKTITQNGIDNSSTKLALPNDILIASAGQGNTRGQTAFCMIETYFNQSLINIRMNTKKAYPKYIFYNISSRYSELRQLSDGHSIRGSLTTKIINKLTIKFPIDINEQKRIADILSAFDDKIELNNQMNQTLEDMATTLFKEWFENFNFPNSDGKAYKTNGGEMKPSELGEIPVDWEIKKLDEICLFSQGIQIDVDKQDLVKKSKNIRFIRIVDYTNENEPERFINIPNYKKYYVDEYDTVMIRYGSKTAGNVVRGKEGIIANNMFRVSPKDSNFSKIYLHSFLSQPRISAYLKSSQSSSTMPAITFGMMSSIKTIIPSNNYLDKFHNIALLIFEQIQQNQQQNQILKKQRDTLLPKLMSGEIRV